MNQAPAELNPSPRILLGPGPSSVHPRVLRAMSTPLLGYLDPEFVTILGETTALRQAVARPKKRKPTGVEQLAQQSGGENNPGQ